MTRPLRSHVAETVAEPGGGQGSGRLPGRHAFASGWGQWLGLSFGELWLIRAVVGFAMASQSTRVRSWLGLLLTGAAGAGGRYAVDSGAVTTFVDCRDIPTESAILADFVGISRQ